MFLFPTDVIPSPLASSLLLGYLITIFDIGAKLPDIRQLQGASLKCDKPPPLHAMGTSHSCTPSLSTMNQVAPSQGHYMFYVYVQIEFTTDEPNLLCKEGRRNITLYLPPSHHKIYNFINLYHDIFSFIAKFLQILPFPVPFLGLLYTF